MKTPDLFKAARETRERAYSPYSQIKVGAAVLTANGDVFTGCNVENSSYGGTNCAERVAIQNAISQKGETTLKEIIVVTDATPPWPPCGLCRQVIAEFAHKENGKLACKIHLANLSGIQSTLELAELLPHAFTPDHLTKR